MKNRALKTIAHLIYSIRFFIEETNALQLKSIRIQNSKSENNFPFN